MDMVRARKGPRAERHGTHTSSRGLIAVRQCWELNGLTVASKQGF
jgi:hypothetical protein